MLGEFLNSIEHALPFPFKDVFYILLSNFFWKIPRLYSDKCYLCRGKIKIEVRKRRFR